MASTNTRSKHQHLPPETQTARRGLGKHARHAIIYLALHNPTTQTNPPWTRWDPQALNPELPNARRAQNAWRTRNQLQQRGIIETKHPNPTNRGHQILVRLTPLGAATAADILQNPTQAPAATDHTQTTE